MSVPTYEPEHVIKGLALLLQQWRTSAKVTGILATYLRQFQTLEDTVWDVINSRMIDTAVGAQLDMLGSLVGELRKGRNDLDYRAAVRLRIRVNRSQGRTVDVIDVATQGSGAPAIYREFPESLVWEIELTGSPSPVEVAKLLQQTKAAGSRGYVVYTTAAPSSMMRWTSVVAPAAGAVWPHTSGAPVKLWYGAAAV